MAGQAANPLCHTVMNARRLSSMLLFIVAYLVMLPLCAEGRESPDADFTVGEFTKMFPSAAKQGACYLLRLDGCRVVAVSTPYAVGRIELIFVNAPKKQTASKLAHRLAKEISPNCKVIPFEKDESWVAVICPLKIVSRRYPTSLFLYRRSIHFIGWQGKLLRVQTEYSTTEYGKIRSKKISGVIEMLVDLTVPNCDHVEFRLIRGRLKDGDIRDFICSSMAGSSDYLPEFFSSSEMRDLRAKFSGHELISYSLSSDFCIVSKRKTYHAGTIEAVSDYVSSKRSIAEFNFPKDETPWPSVKFLAVNEKDSNSSGKEENTAMGTPQKPSSDGHKPQSSEGSVVGVATTATTEGKASKSSLSSADSSGQQLSKTPASPAVKQRYGRQRTAMGSYYGPITETPSTADSSYSEQERADVAQAISRYVEMLSKL